MGARIRCQQHALQKQTADRQQDPVIFVVPLKPNKLPADHLGKKGVHIGKVHQLPFQLLLVIPLHIGMAQEKERRRLENLIGKMILRQLIGLTHQGTFLLHPNADGPGYRNPAPDRRHLLGPGLVGFAQALFQLDAQTAGQDVGIHIVNVVKALQLHGLKDRRRQGIVGVSQHIIDIFNQNIVVSCHFSNMSCRRLCQVICFSRSSSIQYSSSMGRMS